MLEDAPRLEISPSDPNFEDVSLVATMIAAYKNNFMFFELRNMPEAERQAEIKILESIMGTMIEELGR